MNKIILALDTTDLQKALEITKKIIDKIFTVKLGLEFFNANGKSGIQKFNNIGVDNLMLDLKLHDIPQTIYKSIIALEDIKDPGNLGTIIRICDWFGVKNIFCSLTVNGRYPTSIFLNGNSAVYSTWFTFGNAIIYSSLLFLLSIYT